MAGIEESQYLVLQKLSPSFFNKFMELIVLNNNSCGAVALININNVDFAFELK